ncbi:MULTISPECIES: hypothetical protein [Streptomyces]|uniref:Uncharacterized protein n=1 Tax=Streptomyces siderophoricus TaxID=2802281 RepID=A0ABS1N091_9ACTN|nr:hypothetical protein [Streptomyces sp. 9-7]MBL1093453.1 hypothetical protein [Streptomyces sp. 9-7]
MGDSPPSFEKLAEDFADALDAWSQEVKVALSGRPQKVLVNGLGVNQGNVSRWLGGREQIWKGGAALPGAGLTQGVVKILQMQEGRSTSLMQLASQVDYLQKQLTVHGRDWRKRAGDHLQSLTGTPPGTVTFPQAPIAATEDGSEPASLSPTGGDLAVGPGLDPGTSVSPVKSSADSGEPDSLGRPGPDDRQPVTQDSPGRAHWRDRIPKKAKITSAILATLAVGGVLGAAIWNGDTSDGPVSSAGEEGAGAEEGATAPGALEKGVLGEDSRCSAPFHGPEAVTWSVCARVEAERVSFALKLTNQGRAASTVKVRLEYVQATKFHPCPKATSAHSLSIPAGKTVITDPGQCTVPREEAPAAYQGAGWVFAENANAGSYELSPTANVYLDRVIWKPDLVEASPTKSPAQAGVLGGCRGAVKVAHAPISVNPCTSVVNDQLELASHVTASQAGKVTVFVWLTDGDTYRPNVPPHRGTFDLAAGQTATCSTRIQPDRQGTHWQAATAAET